MNSIKQLLSLAICILFTCMFKFSIASFRQYECAQHIFTKIYEQGIWGGGSGPGSDPKHAVKYLEVLQAYIDKPDVHTIFDLGCGDWRLMKKIKVPSSKLYKGFDVVNDLISNHKKLYQKQNIQFYHIKDLKDLLEERGDLLIVKDVIHHWPNEQIFYLIQKILPNFRYALITNGYDKNGFNYDIKLGEYKPIDLEADPFNMKRIQVVTDYPAHGAMKRIYFYDRDRCFSEAKLKR